MIMVPPMEEALSGADGLSCAVQPPDIRPPARDERLAAPPARRPVERSTILFAAVLALVGLSGAAWYGVSALSGDAARGEPSTSRVVDRIIVAESGGCATAANARSTATGPAQFIEATWLALIRRHRPDLAEMDRAEILALRRDRDLSREMAARFAEQNAGVLRRHEIAVTPATLYLAHFAGVAGAVAIMTAPDTQDAARTMAEADARGHITRGLIVNANPFLDNYTIADLKAWAQRKMRRKLASAAGSKPACPAAA